MLPRNCNKGYTAPRGRGRGRFGTEPRSDDLAALAVVPFRDSTSSHQAYVNGRLSLLLFLATVFGAILWYGYVYDPEGIVNHSLTGYSNVYH
jgi:hypothetical protein